MTKHYLKVGQDHTFGFIGYFEICGYLAYLAVIFPGIYSGHYKTFNVLYFQGSDIRDFFCWVFSGKNYRAMGATFRIW